MALPWAFGVKELPQAEMCFLQNGQCFVHICLGIPAHRGAVGSSLLFSHVHTSCFQIRKSLSFLYIAAKVILLERKSDNTVCQIILSVTCLDPSSGIPFRVITKPKVPSLINPLISHLLPFHSLPLLPLLQPQWPSPCS